MPRIDKLIENLNWNSVTINNDDILVYKDSCSNELVSMGKIIAPILVKKISDPQKSIAIHIILSRIYDPKIDVKGMKIFYIDCPETVGKYYIFNNFYWENIYQSNSVSSDEIQLMQSYWTDRINNNIIENLRDSDQLVKRLIKHAENYPCKE